MQKYLFLMAFLYSSVIAKEWITITPLPECNKFKIQYSYDGAYQVRFKPTPQSKYKLASQELSDINNLSLLTDELSIAAQNYCQLEYSMVPVEGVYQCLPNEAPYQAFSSEYTSILEQMIAKLDRKNNCQDVIPLIKLQNKISNLNQNQKFNFYKSESFLQVFTGDETDQMIDHFYECGGEKGSRQFIQNMIILEAKNACLFPKPPGKLDLAEVEEMAKKISAKYSNKGIVELGQKSSMIKKETALTFAKTILTKQIKEILGPNVNTNKFINELDFYKRLKKAAPSKALDYSKYIVGVDAPLEIVDKGLPLMAQEKFAKALPKSMSAQQKKQFIKNEIYPDIKKYYESCIDETKERVLYPFTPKKRNRAQEIISGKKEKVDTTDPDEIRTLDHLIDYRKHLQNEFCDKHPKTCGGESPCEQKSNFFTSRADINDMNVIQACLFKGFTRGLKPVLRKILQDQKTQLKDKLTLSNKMVDGLTQDSYERVIVCMDKTIKDQTKINTEKSILVDIEPLYHIDAKAYANTIEQCTRPTEEKLTVSFASLIVANMPMTQKKFSDSATGTFYGSPVNKKGFTYARNIANKAIQNCTKDQLKRVVYEKTSSALCRPAIEMSVGQSIIKDELNTSMDKMQVAKNEQTNILNSFTKCTDKAINKANNSVHNSKAKTPINNSEQANSYLKNNHQYYNCVQTTIYDVTDQVAKKSLENVEKDISGRLTDPEYFKKLKPKVQQVVMNCMKDGLKKVNSWNEFIEFNATPASDEKSESGLAKLQNKCKTQATEFTAPKIIAHETNLQLKKLNDINLTPLSMEDISLHLQKVNHVAGGAKSMGPHEKVILKVYQKYKAENPNADVQDFVSDYVADVQKYVVSDTAKTVFTNVVESSKPEYDFSELLTRPDGKCLNTYLNIYRPHLETLMAQVKVSEAQRPKDEAATKVDHIKTFSEYIRKGMINAKKNGRYEKTIETIEKVCKEPDRYKDIKEFAKTGLADDILHAVVSEQIRKSFFDTANKQCKESLQLMEYKFNSETITQLCESPINDENSYKQLMAKLQKRLTSDDDKATLNLLANRRLQSYKIVKEELTDELLNKLFYEDKELLKYIYGNIAGIATKDEKIAEAINLKVVDKLFTADAAGDFADRFIETQLISSIGYGGLPQGKAKINDMIDNAGIAGSALVDIHDFFAKTSLKRKAFQAFYNHWDYQNIKNYLNWKETSKSKRNEIKAAIFKNKIRAGIDSSIPQDKKDKLSDEITELVAGHISSYPVKTKEIKEFRRGFRKIKVKKLSFLDILSEDIEEDIKDRIF